MLLPALLVALLVAALAVPAAAHAHASLERATPADGSTVDAAPTTVVLEFTGAVEAGPGAIEVYDADGTRVDAGTARPARGARLTQRVDAARATRAEGTWGVSYTVSSEDGHVIKGVTSFNVGQASDDGAALDASRAAAETPRALELGFSAARFVEVVALLVLAGGGLFACVVAPGWRPRGLGVALALLLAAYAAAFLLNGAILAGDAGSMFDPASLRATAEAPFGRSLMLRAAVAAVALLPVLLLRSGRPVPGAARAALAVVFAGIAASLSITGHAVTTDPLAVRMPVDMLHVLAAAVWVGGLVQLARMAPEASTRLAAIERFSRLAFASVVVIVVTGAVGTWIELDARPVELVDSRYGRLVVAKLLLYLGTMPFAWNNMTAFVPAARQRPEDAPRMLRQYVLRELFLLLVVVALTVWLIATPQPT